jgi:hypothetical protein
MSSTVHFTREQVEFLMRKTGADDPEEALEIFSVIIRSENIEPTKMPLYIKKLMEREGPTK